LRVSHITIIGSFGRRVVKLQCLCALAATLIRVVLRAMPGAAGYADAGLGIRQILRTAHLFNILDNVLNLLDIYGTASKEHMLNCLSPSKCAPRHAYYSLGIPSHNVRQVV
jgi:hypothetical protein